MCQFEWGGLSTAGFSVGVAAAILVERKIIIGNGRGCGMSIDQKRKTANTYPWQCQAKILAGARQTCAS